jgi:hypothetical protein
MNLPLPSGGRFGTCAPTGDPKRDARRYQLVVLATKIHRSLSKIHQKEQMEKQLEKAREYERKYGKKYCE